MRTSFKNIPNSPDIMIHGRMRKKTVLVEIRTTGLGWLYSVKTEMKRVYDVLAKKHDMDYGCATRIIPDDNNTR